MANDEIFKLYASVDVDVRKATLALKKLEGTAAEVAEGMRELGNTPIDVRRQAKSIRDAEKKILAARKRAWKQEDRERRDFQLAAQDKLDGELAAARRVRQDKRDAQSLKRLEALKKAESRIESKYGKLATIKQNERIKEDSKREARYKAEDLARGKAPTKKTIQQRNGEIGRINAARNAEDADIDRKRKAELAPSQKKFAAAEKRAKTSKINAEKKATAREKKLKGALASKFTRQQAKINSDRLRTQRQLDGFFEKTALQRVSDAQRAINDEQKANLKRKRATAKEDKARERSLNRQAAISSAYNKETENGIKRGKIAKNQIKQAKRDEVERKKQRNARLDTMKAAELTGRATKKRLKAARAESPESKAARDLATANEMEANARKKVAKRLVKAQDAQSRDLAKALGLPRQAKGLSTNRADSEAWLANPRPRKGNPNQYKSPIGPERETPAQFARRNGGAIGMETRATSAEMAANKDKLYQRTQQLRWDKKQFGHKARFVKGPITDLNLPFAPRGGDNGPSLPTGNSGPGDNPPGRSPRDGGRTRPREKRMSGLARGFSKGLGFGAAFSGIQLAGEALGASLRMLFQGFMQGAAKAIQLTVEFEKSLRELNGLTKLSEQDLGSLGERLRTVGDRLKIGVDPTKAVDSLRGLFAAGFTDLPTAEKVLDQSLKLSKAGFVDQTKAADLLGSTMIAYGASADEAARYSDALISSTDLGLVTMEQLSQSMGRVTPSAVAAGVSIEEMSAVIGASTATGLRAETSIAGFAQAFKKLTNPTKASREAMAKYGVVIDETTLKEKGLVNTLIEMDKILGGSASKWQEVLGGNTQGRTSVLSLFDAKDGEDRYARLNTAVKTVNDSMGVTAQRLESIMKSAHEQFLLFQSNMQSAGIAITQALGPEMAKFLSLLNNDLKPQLDLITASIAAMIESLMTAFGVTDKNGLKQTLIDIADGIHNLTAFLINLKGVLGLVSATVITVWNILQAIVGGVVDLAKVMGSVLNFIRGKGSEKEMQAALSKFGENIAGQMADIGKSWSDAFSDSWVVALDNNDKAFEKHKKKIIKSHAEIELENSRVAGLKKTVDSASPELQKEVKKLAKDKGLTLAEQARYVESMPLTGGTKNPETIARLNADKNLTPKQRAKYIESLPLEGGVRDVRSPLAPNKVDFMGASSGGNPLVSPAAFPSDADQLLQLASPDPIGDSLLKKLNRPSVKAPEEENLANINIAERMEAIDRLVALEKVSTLEAKSKYEWLLRAAKKQGADAETVFNLEQKIHNLQKERVKEAEKAAEKLQKAQQAMHIETLKATEGEFAARRQALEYEKQERLKIADLSTEEIGIWFNSSLKEIQDEETADKKEKANKANDKEVKRIQLEADLAGMPGGLSAEHKQRMLELDAEELKYKDVEENKTQILAVFAAKRAALEKQHLKDVEDARLSMMQQIVDNEAVTLESKGQTAQATRIQDKLAAELKFKQIQDNVEEFRKAGMSEVDIRRYVLSEQNRIFAEAKQKEKQIEEGIDNPIKSVSGSAADPRMLAENAFDGAQEGLTFSGPAVGQKRKITREGHKWDEKSAMAAKLGALATATGGKGKFSTLDPASAILARQNAKNKSAMNSSVNGGDPTTNKNILEITITAPDGTKQKVLATPDRAVNYSTKLGGF